MISIFALIIILLFFIFSLKQKEAYYKIQLEFHQEELNKYSKKVYTLEKEIEEEKKSFKKIKEDAISLSRDINKGFVMENLAPLLTRFESKDLIFIGRPIDYIAFEGLEDLQTGRAKELKAVTFIEVKSGKSRLSNNQRRIRDFIKNNPDKIKFELIRLDDTN